MYLLGSLVVFFCTQGYSMTHLLMAGLPKEHHFTRWRGTYAEVLPYLEGTFANVIRQIKAEVLGDFAEKLGELVKQLCNPRPELRGHPRNIEARGNSYSLERFVSQFGNLASRAEISLKRGVPLKGEA